MFSDAPVCRDTTVVDVQLSIDGNRLVGTDVFGDGSTSCLRQNLGTYKSPEHAAAMALLMGRPDFLLLIAEGKLDDAQIDRLVEEIRKRKHGGTATKPNDHR